MMDKYRYKYNYSKEVYILARDVVIGKRILQHITKDDINLLANLLHYGAVNNEIL